MWSEISDCLGVSSSGEIILLSILAISLRHEGTSFVHADLQPRATVSSLKKVGGEGQCLNGTLLEVPVHTT